jgi:hypothetical protein
VVLGISNADDGSACVEDGALVSEDGALVIGT